MRNGLKSTRRGIPSEQTLDEQVLVENVLGERVAKESVLEQRALPVQALKGGPAQGVLPSARDIVEPLKGHPNQPRGDRKNPHGPPQP